MGREHHGTNCAYRANPDEPCTCGVTERTEREMHAAWRKRAEEAETALAAMTKERDDQAEAVRVLGMCVEARRREKIARDGFNVHDATKQTHAHHDWVKAIEDRFTADGLVDTNPIARAAVEGER